MSNPDNIVNHKFKPGKSGNPSGRPVGSKSVASILKQLLECDVTSFNPITEDEEEMSVAMAVAFRLVRNAIKDGDLRAIIEIMDRTDGKTTQKVELDGNLNANKPHMTSEEIIEQLNEFAKTSSKRRKTTK